MVSASAARDDDDIDDDADPYDDDDADGPARRGRFGPLRPLISLPRPVLVGIGLVVVMLLGFTTFIVVGGGGEKGGTPRPSAAAGGRYAPQVRQLFLDECTRASQGDANYCACTLEKLEATYSQAEYIKFSNNVDDAESKRIIREVSQSCRAGK
jgi:hypothetical protein